MALSKKQIKITEYSNRILKMRKEVLDAITKNEMSARSCQATQNKENPTVDKIESKRSARKKKVVAVSNEPKKQEEVFAPKPIADEELPIAMPADNSVVRKQIGFKPRSRIISIFILFFIGLMFGFLLFAALIFYIPKTESLLARKISAVVPLPAIIINGRFISYNDYLKEVDAVDRFLARQQGMGIIRDLPPRKQIRKEITDFLIKQEIIKDLVNQYEITVSPKEIDDEIKKIKAKSRSEESFEETLKDLYGWSEDDFGNKVIQNYLMVSKLSDKIFSDIPSDESKEFFDKKIGEIKQGMNIYVLVE